MEKVRSQGAVDDRGIAECRRREQVELALVGRTGPRCRGDQAVIQPAVAVFGGNSQDGPRQRRVERAGTCRASSAPGCRSCGKRAIDRGARLPNDVPVVPDRPERADHDARAARGDRRCRRGGRKAKLVEQRPKHRPDERLEARRASIGRQVFMNESEPLGDFVQHAAGRLAAVAGGQRQVVRGAVPVRPHERPLVVDERSVARAR